MELPQEIIVWHLLPALRKELVLGLKQEGLSQKEIAAKLNITAAAISQYMHNKRAVSKIVFSRAVRQSIKKSISAIKQSKNKDAAAKELVRLVELSRHEKIICPSCALRYPNCKLCSTN